MTVSWTAGKLECEIDSTANIIGLNFVLICMSVSTRPEIDRVGV